jgi:hypothetical protein
MVETTVLSYLSDIWLLGQSRQDVNKVRIGNVLGSIETQAIYAKRKEIVCVTSQFSADVVGICGQTARRINLPTIPSKVDTYSARLSNSQVWTSTALL